MTADLKHTPEPWYVGAQNDTLFIVVGVRPASGNDSPNHDADRTPLAKVYDDPAGDANAARIVACVNACAGMADPAAEITGMRVERSRFTRALEMIVKQAGGGSKQTRRLQFIINVANAALRGERWSPTDQEAPRDRLADILRLKRRNTELLAALRLSNHGLHAADENGPCLCSQCEFVRARDAAIAKVTA